MTKTDAKREALEFLRSKHVAVVCTASKEGEPHAATVFFMVDDNFHVFFVTSVDTQKARDIKENRHVALVAGAENSPFTLQLSGAAEILAGREGLAVITNLTDIAATVPFYWPPILRVATDRLVAIKITPTWVRWLDLRRGNVEKKRVDEDSPIPFVQIIP